MRDDTGESHNVARLNIVGIATHAEFQFRLDQADKIRGAGWFIGHSDYGKIRNHDIGHGNPGDIDARIKHRGRYINRECRPGTTVKNLREKMEHSAGSIIRIVRNGAVGIDGSAKAQIGLMTRGQHRIAV